tara:strand:- start:9811 stop:10935 length:1125 start_codon:yes stop_codon:yes gene_type:complete
MSKVKRKLPEISSVISNPKTNVMTFKISNINYSFVNALRRTILSNIPIAVFRTTPYEKNNCIITTNTSRLNNEILKQRLSCIPIHIKDLDTINNLELIIEKENTSDNFIYVTTDDFQLKDTTTDKFLSKSEVLNIFPPDPITNDHIIFSRLRSKITKKGKGEEINLSCKMTVSTAEENGSFNVVSTCSYNFEDDTKKQNIEWSKYEKTLSETNKTKLAQEKKNWFNHKAKKFHKDDSFNFILETIGIYSNIEIIKKACSIINNKLDIIKESLSNNALINESINTINNCYDITLVNEDYTIGKLIEYILHEDYYKNGPELKYVGFNKKHPHNKNSIIRIAFNNEDDSNIENVKTIIKYSIEQCKIIINNINESFG